MRRFYGNGNRILVPALPAIDFDGTPSLSVAAQQRADRAIEEYCHSSFRRGLSTILIVDLFEKEHTSTKSGAELMGEYAIRQYGLPRETFLIEAESTNIEEGFALSFKKYPEFFEGIMNGNRKLGIASHLDDMNEVAKMGSKVLGIYGKWIKELPTSELYSEIGKNVISRFAEQPYTVDLAMAAD